MIENIKELLFSSAKINRDKGLELIEKELKTADNEQVRVIEDEFLKTLDCPTSSWECKYGALMGSKFILESQKFSTEFSSDLLKQAEELLDDGEYRIRITAGEVIGSLCKKVGLEVYTKIKPSILRGIQMNLDRQPLTESIDEGKDDTENLIGKLASGTKKRRNSADAAQIFHDTAGWKSLETWMKCLQFAIEGCGHRFNQFIDQELLNLIFQTLSHTNRFVRETGYYVCSSLVGCHQQSKDSAMDVCYSLEENAVYQFGEQFAEQLAAGLADNWSQVRLAASVATRSFLLSLPDAKSREKFLPTLIPPMCLNRYYVAEGVRIYSQETWAKITEGHGIDLVQDNIDFVVTFYISQTEADNHAVREAACACIAELGSKIDKKIVSPYIPKLLDALLVCFNDDSWPVRDAACIACGNFVLCFPEESRSSLPALYPLFFNNLQDNIASVRLGAAVALSNVVKAYGKESFEVVSSKIKSGLEGVEHQKDNVEKYGGLDKSPANYSVVKQLMDNDMELHTDRQMYSCGSLAPKMGRGKREGGCMDHKFRKPSEPWELADGCISLVAELSSIQEFAKDVSMFLPLIVKALNHQHYTQHEQLLETFCKQLHTMAKGLGKRYFKPHLETFFEHIFHALKCDTALTSAAASQCIHQLEQYLGPSILRGRVEKYDPKYLQCLDEMRMGPPM